MKKNTDDSDSRVEPSILQQLSPAEKMLYSLLEQKTRSTHTLKKIGLGDVYLAIDDQNLFPIFKMMDEKNFKDKCINSTLLDLYFKYIDENFLKKSKKFDNEKILEQQGSISHHAYNAASCVYIDYGALMNQFFRSSYNFQTLFGGIELIFVEELKLSELPNEKDKNYMIVVNGIKPWKIYFFSGSSLGTNNCLKDLELDDEKLSKKLNLEKIQDKSVLEELSNLSDQTTPVMKSRYLLRLRGAVNEFVKAKHNQIAFPKHLTDDEIILITSNIVLSYGLNYSKYNKQDLFERDLYRIISLSDCSSVYTHFSEYYKIYKEQGMSSWSSHQFNFSSMNVQGAPTQHIFIRMPAEQAIKAKGKFLGYFLEKNCDNEYEFVMPPGTSFRLEKVSNIENYHFYQAHFATERYQHATDQVMEVFFNYCQENYFSKPFEEMKVPEQFSPARINPGAQEDKVHRSFHGAVVAVRKKERLSMILEFFNVYTTDEGFRDFCQSLRQKEQIVIKFGDSHQETLSSQQLINELSLVMSSTCLGRLSDSHEKEDVERYRFNTKEEFKKIVSYIIEKCLEFKISKTRLDIYLEVLLILCDLEKMKRLNHFAQYVVRIVFVTLTLDLNRCYPKESILKNLTEYLSSFIDIADSKAIKAFEALLDYSACQTQITDDCILANDHIVPSREQGKKGLFATYSHNLTSCQRVLRGLPSICFEEKLTSMSKEQIAEFNFKMITQLLGARIDNNQMNFSTLSNKNSIRDNFSLLMQAAVMRFNLKAANAFLKNLITQIRNIDNPKNFNEEFGSPLETAAGSAKFDDTLVTCLLEAKCDPNKKNTYTGKTALFSAVQSNSTNKVKLLLENKADVNITDKTGKTPHQYADSENIEMIGILIV